LAPLREQRVASQERRGAGEFHGPAEARLERRVIRPDVRAPGAIAFFEAQIAAAEAALAKTSL
jgi:hypothetical protein